MQIKNRIPVAVLGATGSVGQKFIQLLEDHPYFRVTTVCASEKSAGRKYGEAVNWVLPSIIPDEVADLVVEDCRPGFDCPLVFSGLDASVAGEIEERFALAGYQVVSNARNHRFDPHVPLLIPEVNPDHLQLLPHQSYNGGCIVTNPNCSTIGMTMALKPLQDAFGLESVNVVTMQAISGAGFPGIASLTISDNVVPFISGEEDKMEREPKKILGKFAESHIEEAALTISAQCNRVPVIDGHLESVQVRLSRKAAQSEVTDAWQKFRSRPQELGLPSAPAQPIHYHDKEDYPQPRLHRNLEKGMAVSVGRLQECPLFDYKFSVLSHNTVRGAAGGAILCAELMMAEGYIPI